MFLNVSAVNETQISFGRGEGMEASVDNLPFMFSYIVLSVVGVVGNSLVITLIWKKRCMRSTTNILLAFVAVADLISLVCFVPFAFFLAFPIPGGILGAIFCCVFARPNVASVTIAVSITTLALLAIERFHALLKPMNNRLRLNKNNVSFWICGILVYAVALNVPLFVFTEFDKQNRICAYDFGANGRRNYFAVFGFGVALAVTVICYCYWRIIKGFFFGSRKVCVSEELQHKRRVVKLLLLITLAFIVCFIPRVIYYFFYFSSKGLFHQVSLFLLHCNSAMNPIILGFQSENYRTGFKEIIGKAVGNIRSKERVFNCADLKTSFRNTAF